MKTLAAIAVTAMLAAPAYAACKPAHLRGAWMWTFAATDYPATMTCLTVVDRYGEIIKGWCDEDSPLDSAIVRNTVTDGVLEINRSCMVRGEVGTGFGVWTFKRGWLSGRTMMVTGADTFFGAVWSGVGLRR